jgi:hypothetical protein
VKDPDIVNDNGGGTTDPAAFTLIATGMIEGNAFSGTSDGMSEVTSFDTFDDVTMFFKADTFTLSETGVPGYAATWTCVETPANDEPMIMDAHVLNVGDQIAVGIGQDVTCTAKNDDIAPLLQLRKVVINDDGGTAGVSDFTLTATGTLLENIVSGTGSADSTGTLLADTFALTETGPAGYVASEWVCVGGTQEGANVTLLIGQTATCTITNKDVAAPVTTTLAPPTAPLPVILPPAMVRGTATLAGPRGCVAPGTVTTRVSGRNIANVRFYRDGRLVKRVTVNSSRLRTVMLKTRIAATDHKLHRVVARVQYMPGTTPRTRVLSHRFGQCTQSVVTR